jgi:hypothetical protein
MKSPHCATTVSKAQEVPDINRLVTGRNHPHLPPGVTKLKILASCAFP